MKIETVIDTVIGWIDQLGWINKFSDEDGQAATKVKSVLFVCWGNVCRSPAAEIILKQEMKRLGINGSRIKSCLLYTSPSPRDATLSRMPSSA